MRPLRFLSAILAAGVLLPLTLCLSACSEISDSARARELLEGLSQNYSTDARLSAGETVLAGHIERPNPGQCSVELFSPESISGLRYEKSADGVWFSYKGLSFVFDETADQLSSSSPLIRAADALSGLLLPEPRELPVKNGGHWELRAGQDGKGSVLWLSEETGLPIKLLLEDGETEILLENFVFFD